MSPNSASKTDVEMRGGCIERSSGNKFHLCDQLQVHHSNLGRLNSSAFEARELDPSVRDRPHAGFEKGRFLNKCTASVSV